MKNNKINPVSRILLLICGTALLVVLFVPMWRIDLQAPQYPEGLRMLIYPNKLAGNIDVINGLNHYIGMKTLHSDDFPEFKILPGIIITFAALFVFVAIVAKRKFLNILCILFVAFGILAMVDFWRWEYAYGHDLDPNAAIIVPGMSYQPPLIGFKQLLNFGAYSMPDIGGWIFLSTGIVLLGCVVFEWNHQKKSIKKYKVMPGLGLGFFILSLSACNTGPEPIRIGQDQCNYCKMTISDNRFGAEIVTKKSKVYKFDDEHCIVRFFDANSIAPGEISGIYFVNFNSPHQLINVEDAYFLQSPTLKSPMNGNIAAFVHEDSLVNMLPQFKGNMISWEDMQK